MCLDLGLHVEPPFLSAELDPRQLDMRRRIFWSAWETDVSLSAALLRPMAFKSNRTIDVPFPSELEDQCITSQGIDPSKGGKIKYFAHGIWKFRRLESECCQVLFQNHPFDPVFPTLDGWIKSVDARFRAWRDEVYESVAAYESQIYHRGPQASEVLKWADIALDLGLVTLYRPSPRVRMPKPEHLLILFEAACNEAKGYREQSQLEFGISKYRSVL
jgi:hypothetical protein